MNKNKARDKYLLAKYGISLTQYNLLLNKQGGGCAICGKTPEQEGKNLAVDHIHIKGGGGEIRGVLCQYCNHRRVGRHTDSALVHRIADYLDNHTGFFTPLNKKKKRRVSLRTERKRRAKIRSN